MYENTYVLSLSCTNRPGIVAAVSNKLLELGGNITDAQQFDDLTTGRFFSRIEFETRGPQLPVQRLRDRLAAVLDPLEANWHARHLNERKRILLLVSKQDHCLADLLYRQRTGELRAEIAGIISNHPQTVHSSVGLGDIPYFHMPVDPENKPKQEEKLLALTGELQVNLVVLARYMQVLSDPLCSELAGWCINIHHSFLPGFKGAKPYHQAYDRGVKLIGATAHYVTGELDEGPIITQDVEPTSHRDTPGSLARKGRDIERRVLASAVHHHLEDRVFLNGKTTVVFPE
ncbi:formyltetrahydrofolate deformylase [Arthrobacter mangrovi]|uniref:Formyltetrahydrofolate deformylase n=1 Tax=Arthrobacter mangrovi TaxID=2966350 RepID=A0ABQ5MYW0_9MICC|nr:formyltetrahydrofolate deformylase [Arthrobacter mangrovi]GLB69177.1 formyltetrahydrofolate deformylase [Arthrobacter mangrovi]